MCGRYNFNTDNPDVKIAAIISVMERKYSGKYKTGDIFPGDTAPAMIVLGDKIVAVPAVFGFPGFQDGKLLINARGETATEKKTFSDCLKDRRIILPATGFYEWSSDKTKYLFSVGPANLFYLCGLYKIINGQYHFVILTRAANESMIDVHHRMPVIVDEHAVRPYLTDLSAATELLGSAAPTLERQEF